MSAVIAPEFSHLFAAMGAAMNYKQDTKIGIRDLHEKTDFPYQDGIWSETP